MPEINLNTLAEIRIQEATELLKSIFGKYEKPPVERCVDMSGFAGPVPDDVPGRVGKVAVGLLSARHGVYQAFLRSVFFRLRS